MKEDNGSLCGENHDDKQNNDRYSIVDAVGKQHVFIAGKDGVTEEWIARLRHDENELRTSDFKFYYLWNGKNYVRVVYRSDDISPAELEHYSTMHDKSADVEQLIIEREAETISHTQYLAAMASLTKKQKELIYKMFVLGMSKADIAREEGVKPTSIQSRCECICKKFVKFFE